MTRDDVINNIKSNYSQYGIDMKTIEDNIRSGESHGFSYQTIYTGLRMALSSTFGINEFFTVDEIAEALGESRENIISQIEEMREEIAAAGLDPDDYALPTSSPQRFVIPPGALN